MEAGVFTEVSMLLALSAIIAMLMRALKQPMIIGYILTGVIVGPSLLGIVESPETIESFGNFGIALLLFIVGLGLNPRVIKEVGRVATLTGVGQVAFTTGISFAITRALGYSSVAALYISVAMAFSSTIIILKLLSDKKEQNKLYGKISIGFLLVQDILATIALVVASAAGSGGLSYSEVTQLGLKGIWLGLLVYVISHFVVAPLTNFLSRSQELLFLFALAWGFGIGALFYEAGFSLEVGALIAGVALATMPYAQEVGSRLRPLRDFFIVVFFIALGSRLNLGDISSIIWQAALLASFVLVGNPIIVMSIMGLLGYTKKTSFKAGLAVAQISEFSLIFILIGQRTGQVSDAVVSLVTVVALITIALSSYMIIYSDSLYQRFEKFLFIFERQKAKRDHERSVAHEAILFGYKKGGHEFIKVFKTITKHFAVVDYDPDVIDELEHQGVPYIYGDVTDPELLEEVDMSKLKLIVTLVSDHSSNVFLLHHMEMVNPKAVIICHADSATEAAELYTLGASYVMMPTHIGSEKISAFIKKNGFSKTEFKRYRKKHIEYIQKHYEPSLDA